MSGADKTIRYSVESQGADKLNRQFEETNRKVQDIANSNRKASKEEIGDIEKKIKLLQQLQRQQEENYRKEINSRSLSSQQDANFMREYQLDREEQSRKLTGKKRKAFDQETWDTVGEYKRNDIRERQELINLRREAQDKKEAGKKQIDELKNVSETIRGEGTKTRRDSSEVISRISSGGSTLMSGNLGGILGGLLRFAGPVAAAGMLVSTVVNATKTHQESMRSMAVATQLPISVMNKIFGSYRHEGLGLSPDESMAKGSSFIPALTQFIKPEQMFGLVGAQRSRGFSDQQITQLLSIQRYTGVSTLGTISNLEEFSKARGDKQLYKLPELMDHYLRTANEILNKTGKVDPLNLIRTMTSISGSYGLSGVRSEQMMSGIVGAGTYSQGGGIMNAIRMQTLKKLYPGMSPLQMMRVMEDPTKDPKYLQALTQNLVSLGNGGEWTGVNLMAQGFSWNQQDLLRKHKFNLTGEYKSSGEKHMEDKYVSEGTEMMGSIVQLETLIGGLKDAIVSKSSEFFDLLSKWTVNGSEYERTIERAVEKGTAKANKGKR